MSAMDERMSRRGFIGTAVSGLVAAGVAGALPRGAFASQDEKKNRQLQGKVLTRKLGRTGIELPIVSMGVMNADNPGVVKASYELGIRHFDTAAHYQEGNNERMVGNVIRELGVRDEVVIGTKIFHPGMRRGLDGGAAIERMMSECDKSLERLRMDYVDILYVHNVEDSSTVRDGAIAEAMQRIKKQGKARFIGVTTHRNLHYVLNEAVASGIYDVVLTVINFTLADYTELTDAIRNAASKGVGIIAMKTQAGSQRSWNREVSKDIPPAAIATASLKWVLRNEHITTAIPGYTIYEHMEQDFSVAYGLEYTEEEKRFFGEVDVEVGIGFCRQCDYCMASCPRGVAVPSLMRTHLYAVQYGNFDQARRTIDEIPAGSGMEACAGCPHCSVRCRHAVDVARRIDELKLIYA